MDFGMLEPLCVAYQIPDYHGLVVSNRRVFHIEVSVEFVHLGEPPSVTSSDCNDDRLVPDVSREERYEFWIAANELTRDVVGERNVRDMLTDAGVMYTRHHEFMIQIVLISAASIACDEHNRDAVVLPMRVSISCADPRIHRELMMSEEEGLEMAYHEAEDMDTDEDEDEEEEEEEEEVAMIGPRLEGLTEVEVREISIDCVICCEDILAGSTASSMPCCHVYHRECIEKWLKNSRTCPLCRLELPPTD